MMVHDEAMTDLRALKLLESLTSREHVMELIEGNLSEPLTFKRYPKYRYVSDSVKRQGES